MVESIERLCGEIAVKIGELEDDFEDTNEDFEEIRKFLADLKVDCENIKNAHYDNW